MPNRFSPVVHGLNLALFGALLGPSSGSRGRMAGRRPADPCDGPRRYRRRPARLDD